MIFSEQKVAHMAAFFLASAEGPLPHLTLIKLLYLADRESMARFDVPMSDDRAVYMPHGPVLSSTLDLIKGRLRSEVWSAWISPLVDHEVRLVHDVENWDDLDELSRSDRSILESVWQEFGHMTKYQLRDYTHHHIGEWHDPHGSSRDIDPKDTFMALGQSEELAEIKARDLAERRRHGRKLSEFI